jgi:hypothetical protein
MLLGADAGGYLAGGYPGLGSTKLRILTQAAAHGTCTVTAGDFTFTACVVCLQLVSAPDMRVAQAAAAPEPVAAMAEAAGGGGAPAAGASLDEDLQVCKHDEYSKACNELGANLSCACLGGGGERGNLAAGCSSSTALHKADRARQGRQSRVE